MTSTRTLKVRILRTFPLILAALTVLTTLAAPATAQNPVPFLHQPLVPDATPPGGAGCTLTVNGAWFLATSVVNWNDSPRATTFVGSSQLTAKILASDIAKASTASVTVVNPSPGGGFPTLCISRSPQPRRPFLSCRPRPMTPVLQPQSRNRLAGL
jgi:hypothetical protein